MTAEATVIGVMPNDDDALERKKLLASTSFSALNGPPDPSALQGDNKYAAFRGLYVVQSATEARHVKYAMEIASPELQLHMRITQRYSAFYIMRKRLLQSLTKCQDGAARPQLHDHGFFGMDLSLRRRACCAGCASVRKALKRLPFPRRALVFTTVDDVDTRAPVLETFLSECLRLVSDWPGCARGRKFACVVLGQFLSMNLLFHVFQQLRLTLAETSMKEDAAPALQRQATDDTDVHGRVSAL